MMSRRGVGTAVFGGMLGAAIIGIFLIPLLYVVFQWAREKVKGQGGTAHPDGHGEAAADTGLPLEQSERA